MKLTVVILILSIGLLSCNMLRQSNDDTNNNLYNDWRVDTLGCLKLRTLSNAKYIRDSLNIVNKESSFVINKLGQPNFQTINSNIEIIRYYFDTYCHESEIIDTLDYCWLEMSFEREKVKTIDIICH